MHGASRWLGLAPYTSAVLAQGFLVQSDLMEMMKGLIGVREEGEG